MKKKFLSLLLVFILFFKVEVFAYTQKDTSSDEFYTISLTGDYDYETIKEVFKLVNKEREKENLSALKLDNKLTELAMLRARENSIYFSHTRPNGKQWSSLLSDFSGYVGENLAVNYSTPSEVVREWMASEKHKENILTEKWNSIGIGYYKIGNYIFWTQLFSEEKSTTPLEKSGIIKGTEDPVEIIEENILFDVVWPSSEISVKLDETISPKKVNFTNLGYDKIVVSTSKKDYNWVSSDSNIFTVDENGTISGHKVGTATLTVSLGNVKKEYPVKVSADLKSISLGENFGMRKGEVKELLVQYFPLGATIPEGIKTTWSTSNPKVVTVTNGKIKAVGLGDATLTVQVGDKVDKIQITVFSDTLGDMDGDSKVTVRDLLQVFRLMNRRVYSGYQLFPVDINQNDSFNVMDIGYMIQLIFMNKS